MRALATIPLLAALATCLVACKSSTPEMTSATATQSSNQGPNETASTSPVAQPTPTAPVTSGSETPTNNSAMGGAQRASAPMTLSDAEIVGIEDVANKGEIEAAQLALKNAQDADVKAFAKMMIAEHGEAQSKAQVIIKSARITPAQTPTSSQLKTESESTMTTLKGQTGKGFDKAYIDSQVKAHREVLTTIDEKLLPNAQSPELKSHVADVRKHVAHHLERAEQIQKKLGSSTP